jgi:superfamily II DNA or RNA helicase
LGHDSFIFLAHSKELVEQGYMNFRKLWPEVTVGRMVDIYHDTDETVICASVQSVSRNLELFQPDDFGYLIIDECHHASAETYRRILSYFRVDFTLGLTATPERSDNGDIYALFDNNVAVEIRLRQALEYNLICPFQ